MSDTTLIVELSDQLHARRIGVLYDEITEEKSNNLRARLTHLHYRNPDEWITLVIHSGGGRCQPAMWLAEHIELFNLPIIGVVAGNCHSMAIPVLQSCRRRLATPTSEFYPHSISHSLEFTAFGENNEAHFLEDVQRTNALQLKIWDVIAARCGKEREEVEKLCAQGDNNPRFRLTAEDALGFGLVDEIVTRLDLLEG